MLRNIDPLLNGGVLKALRDMGHGDEVVLCDTNFPSDSTARLTSIGHLLHIDASCARVARAVLSVMPLDQFVDHPAMRMEVVGRPDEIPDPQREVQAVIDEVEGKPSPMAAIERFAFYERAKRAYAVILTHELRFYGCVIFKKGVIGPA
jgi:L-fucose mutarotase